MDHPHACGDKDFKNLATSDRIGSSPRVWGQVQDFYDVVNNYRIIPTRVGTRVFANANFLAREDHPHACGDKDTPQGSLSDIKGSSPRVWGQADDLTDTNGDKSCSGAVIVSMRGSSPRVWGQEDRHLKTVFVGRIIPTRVGTRKILYVPLFQLLDHPHACGDKFHQLNHFGFR